MLKSIYNRLLFNNHEWNFKKVTVVFLLFVCVFSLANGQEVKKSGDLNSAIDSIYPMLISSETDSSLVASIGYTKGAPLKSIPISSVSNALTGRIAGLNVFQALGQPGNDNGSFSLRGRSPLVLVDGIPRNSYSILTDHVESVTVLKDALATAALGLRGANGAILITTRKKSDKAEDFSMNLTVQSGTTESLGLRKVLPAYQYAQLYNEALRNDHRQERYSQSDIDIYKNGSNPELYSNNDWNSIAMKDRASYQRYTLNAAGNSKTLRYFVATDYLTQDGIFKESDVNKYSTNANFERYGFRGNVEFDLGERTSVGLNLYGAAQKRNSPGGSVGLSFAPNTNTLSISSGSVDNIFSGILNTPSNAYPIYNPDGSLGGNAIFSNNIWGQLVNSGYSETNTNEAFADLIFKRDMGDVLEGWWIKTTGSYTMEIGHSLFRNKNFQSFEMTIDPITKDSVYSRFGPQTGLEQVNSSSVQLRNGTFFLDAATGLDRTFGDNKLSVGLNYQFSSSRFSSQLPFVIHNGVVSAKYNIANKYIFDVVSSYSGNNWFQSGSRYDLYPSAGVAWNIHEEDFFSSHSFINSLKLRTSYGLVGNIDANYFSYLYTYSNYGNAYFIGTGVGGVQGSMENQLPYARTTEKARKFNIGTDISLLNNRLAASLDYYRDNHYGEMIVRGDNTALLGAPYPGENLGETVYSGFEGTVGWSEQKKSFKYYVGGNIAFQKSEIIDNDQPKQPYEWMERRGNSVAQIYGYKADGFITKAGDGPVVEGYSSTPGDIKYVDMNKDGVIDQYDVVAIGNNKPVVSYGINAAIAFKGFDFNILFQGTKNVVRTLTGLGEWEFQNNGTGPAFENHLNRWTPETAATATYPRLTAGRNINNHVVSSFWVSSLDFLRLKSAEVGYTFTGQSLTKIGLSEVRIFATGYNLATFSSMKRIDPENASYGYPLQRMYNGGITVRF